MILRLSFSYILAFCVMTAVAQPGSVVNVVNADFACVPTNRLIIVTATTSNVQITLPPATATAQVMVIIVKAGTKNVTVVKNGADTKLFDPSGGAFMGGTSCAPGEALTVESDGVGNWLVIQVRNNACNNWVTSSSLTTAQAQVPKGTGSGQLLFWDNTNSKWVTTNKDFAANITTSGSTGLEVHCTTQSGTGLNSTTHFVDFFDGAGKNRGTIGGQSASEWDADPINKANEDAYNANNVLNVGLIAAGAVAGGCGVSPPFAVCIAVATAAIVALQVVQLGVAISSHDTIKGHLKGDQLGITYGSSSGDYAEYLKREDAGEHLYPGDIVGVKNGLISKNTNGAQSVFSISLSPIVLGNVPPENEGKLYNKVGFLGQVPVKVRGAVKAGDFICASGLNDGIGKAISAETITPEQFTMVIGRAWEDSPLADTRIVKHVRVAVGLNAKTMSEIMSRDHNELVSLKNEVVALRQSISHVEVAQERMSHIRASRSSATRPALCKPY